MICPPAVYLARGDAVLKSTPTSRHCSEIRCAAINRVPRVYVLLFDNPECIIFYFFKTISSAFVTSKINIIGYANNAIRYTLHIPIINM